MDISSLRPVFDRQGPFATVYLEGRSPGEDAPTQVRLRWKELRERLADAGAGGAALDAITTTVYSEQPGEVQTNGRVLVSSDAGLLLDSPWDAALGRGDAAYWSTDPELGALVREQARSVRLLVVVANQHGATVRQVVVAREHTMAEVDSSSVEGGSISGVHKPREGGLSHNQIQRHADEAVRRNAKDIVQHLASVANRFTPRAVVLAGESKGRTAIRGELSEDLARILVETDRGGTDDDTAEVSLANELRRIASELSARDAEAWSASLAEASAHDRAVDGSQLVARAAEQGLVATLLLAYQRQAPDEPTLLRACVRGGADIGLLPDENRAGPEVAAILRAALPTTTGGNEA